MLASSNCIRTQITERKIAVKFDITKPMPFKVGLYELNGNENYNFQLNRLVNMDGADLELVRKAAERIHDHRSWKRVLLGTAVKLDKAGDIKNAAAFYRMSEFYMEWDDPHALRAWKRARKLFFKYYRDYFTGTDPVVEYTEIPYDGYKMPCLKMKPCHKGAYSAVTEQKGTIVMNGGFDSSFEEFFPPMEYLRENGYTVYLFEGPGQGACIRLYGAPLTMEWEKPVKAVLDRFDLTDVCLIGASLGGYFSPRAAAYERRITSFVSWPAFSSLTANLDAFMKHSSSALEASRHIGKALDGLYRLKTERNRHDRFTALFKTYYHRLGCRSFNEAVDILESINTKPLGRLITQDVLLLGAEKDLSIHYSLADLQKADMPNARSVTTRILTDKEQASDHCNCGNQKLAMDIILDWLDDVKHGRAVTPASFRDEYTEYISAHPYKTADAFRYILDGDAEQSIVFFNGLNMQEMWVPYMKAFSGTHRVLMMEYPTAPKTNNELLDAIHALFGKLGISKPVIISSSDGGVLAQLYLRRFPDDISALVMMTTVTIDSKYCEDTRKELPVLPALQRFIGAVPYSMLRKRLIGTVTGYLNDETHEEKQYGRSFLETVADNGYKDKFISAIGLVGDMSVQPVMRAEEFTPVEGKILLLQPEKDIFTEADRKKLNDLIPTAERHTMRGGHLSFIMCADEHIALIKGFLNRISLS